MQPDKPDDMTENTTFPANAFLIGAQKAGTTFLASLLDQSPDVCVSSPKEPHYLTHQHHRGPDWYAGCFADPAAKVRLDASTTYSVLRPRRDFDRKDAPGILDPVPQMIADAAPNAKLIYLLRDPVKRAASAWRHMARSHPAPSGPVSLMDCIEKVPMLALTGRYADQIERYLEVFPIERFLFLDFRKLTADPLDTVAQCCDFLGISHDGFTLDDDQTEKHAAWQMTGVGRALRRANQALPGLQEAGRRMLPARIERLLIDRVLRQPSEITFTDEAEVAELFAEDRLRLRELTGLTI